MKKVTIDANAEQEAKAICINDCGFTPDAIREVDSGDEDTRAWMCFESAADAELWDNQK